MAATPLLNYVEDTMSGQFMHVYFQFPTPPSGVASGAGAQGGGTSGIEVAGIQAFNAGLTDPAEIVTDISGKQRYRETGPYRVEWTIQRWVIRDNTLPQLLRLQDPGASGQPYGNFNWRQIIFNIDINFIETAQNGITVGNAEWLMSFAKVLTWQVSLPDPYGFVTEQISGLAFSLTEK